MAKRVKLSKKKAPRRRLLKPQESLAFIPSGCALLDCVLGGGWVLGRVGNIVGDKSTGKTLLVIEACANFAYTFPKGKIRYNEAESAFDVPYAETLGLPVKRVQFKRDCDTVEQFYEDLKKFAGTCKTQGLYILDSLDALSDKAEMARGIEEGSYGANKPKKMGELFRKIVRVLEDKKVTLLIVSQVRDKIGVTYGKKTTRSGGRALDFYASQVIWLNQLKTLTRTIRKQKRPTAILVRAKCEKNKVAMPMRECQFPITFGYGVDDITAGVEWLISAQAEDLVEDLGINPDGLTKRLRAMDPGDREDLRIRVAAVVVAEWSALEAKFAPRGKKYG